MEKKSILMNHYTGMKNLLFLKRIMLDLKYQELKKK